MQMAIRKGKAVCVRGVLCLFGVLTGLIISRHDEALFSHFHNQVTISIFKFKIFQILRQHFLCCCFLFLLSDRQLSTFGLLYHIFIASAYKKCIQNGLKFTPFIFKLYFNKFIKDQKKSVKFCSIGLFCETVNLNI